MSKLRLSLRSRTRCLVLSASGMLFLAGCVSGAKQAPLAPVAAQKCEGDSTPVVDEKWNPLGCNKAKKNKVDEGNPCDSFTAGARTTDVKGEVYECKE